MVDLVLVVVTRKGLLVMALRSALVETEKVQQETVLV